MKPLDGLHIVIVPSWWPSPEQPRAGVFFADYVEAFVVAGARVGVVYPDLVSFRHIARAGAKAVCAVVTPETTAGDAPVLRIRGLQTSFGSLDRRIRRFRAWLRRGLAAYRKQFGEPDLLHAMCAIPAGWACTNLDDPLSSRVVLTEHTGPFSLLMDSPESAALTRVAFRRAARRVAVSEHLRSQIALAGIRESTDVCGNPVASLFTKGEVAKRQGNGMPRGLFVGRMTHEKGIPELLTAIDSFIPHLEMHIVGSGPLESTVNANRHVVRHAECPRSAVVEHMRDADFLVHSSHGETFGMTVAEALCMGLPVVTTRGTACAEFIDEDNGLLVDARNAESLRAGLSRMIETYRDYDRERIARTARERFSGAGVASWYAKIFRDVTGGPGL